MEKKDVEHLEWLYDRLVNVVQMDKNVDYLRRFKRIIENEKIIEVEKSEPIIIKSGDTWVAEFKGLDYLCILPETPMDLLKDMTPHKIKSFWKPISEIEITDKIAKLRPMIINNIGETVKLYGIEPSLEFPFIGFSKITDEVDGYKLGKLATVKDLQEIK